MGSLIFRFSFDELDFESNSETKYPRINVECIQCSGSRENIGFHQNLFCVDVQKDVSFDRNVGTCLKARSEARLAGGE